LIVWSLLPEASVLPSGLYATEVTAAVWPLSVAFSLPPATSHSLMVLSPLPEASALPSGLNATQNTLSVCPVSVAFGLGCWANSGDSGSSPRQATPSHTGTRWPRLTLGLIAYPPSAQVSSADRVRAGESLSLAGH